MKIAVIDCGSNTFNLLIAEATQTGWTTIFQSKLPVKLGAGGYQSKEIIRDRFIRGIDALISHAANIRNVGCERVFAFATSAIREASNGKDFMDRAFELTGIRIETIDGEKEAELIYMGIKQTIDTGDHTFLVMDIGGGSTEFIIANQKGILWKQSFKLGVSRLFDKIQPSDPMEAGEVEHLKNLLSDELQPLRDALKEYPVSWLVGSSGSFDTLLELYYHGQNLPVDGSKLSNEILLSAMKYCLVHFHTYMVGLLKVHCVNG